MRLLIRGRSGPRRRGVILLVVLSMLTLFALVGVSFVLTADAQATAARIAREAESAFRPDIDPESAFSMFMGQLLYDVPDDAAGINSAMRGQSLARNVYGLCTDKVAGQTYQVLNDKPYSGTGRLHATTPFSSGVAQTDAALVNYQYLYKSTDPSDVNFLRHPERPGFQPAGTFNLINPAAGQKPYAGGFGVPYTYPDHNNLYLAEIDPATGGVIVPSFHRNYLFGALSSSNPNMTSPSGKYLTLRPTNHYHPSFPAPLDAGGDVKNLDFAPGGADSIWIDIGAPVMTAADGRKYKMLVAPLILALDGRIDLNTVGNVMGAGSTHRSNQGWGLWEVNPTKVLNANATEWTNLFNGSSASGNAHIRGRYDASPRGPVGAAIAGSNKVRDWMKLDYNGMNDTTGAMSTALALQTAPSATSYFGYPTFDSQTFGNGVNENTNTLYGGGTSNGNHASIYNALRPHARGTNIRFPIASAAQMLRVGGSGSDMLVSDPMRLLPTNLVTDGSATWRRNLVSLLNADLDRPGATPYLSDTSATSPYRYQLQAVAPVAPATVTTAYTPTGLAASPFPALTSAGTKTGEFDQTWRSALAKLRLDLYRQLTAYPTPDATTFLMDPTVAAQATTDRQTFANDIFNVLLAVTGALSPQTAYDTYGKTSPEYRASRYCAQLAVNIVDQIDTDDISTPFNWSNFTSANATKDVVNDWVFGVETPRLVINEAYISYDNDPASIMMVAGVPTLDQTKNYNVNVWVELFNPMPPSDTQPAATAPDATAHLSTSTGANLTYRILIADQTPNATVANAMLDPGNSLGDPDYGQPAGTTYGQPASSVRSVLDSWGNSAAGGDPQAVIPGGGKFDWSANATKNDGFYVFGPTTTFVDNNLDNPNLTTTATSAKMSYSIPIKNANAETKPRPTVLLQRLANPSLAFNNTPGAGYNPYITIDYIRNSAAFIMDGRRFTAANPTSGAAAAGVMNTRNSVGRRQPLTAANGQRIAQAPTFTAPATAPANQPKHTFSRQNCTFDTKGGLDGATTDTTLKIPFDWMTHLDRLPVNPLELLNVGDSRPHDLTQRFYTGGVAQGHLAPWASVPTTPTATPYKDSRLYRFFEFVTTPTPATPVTTGGTLPTTGGRVMGKVNINAIRDQAVFRALADAQQGNSFYGPAATPDQNVDAIYSTFVTRRGTIGVGTPPGPTDAYLASLSGATQHFPIWSLSLGQATASSPPTDPFLTASSGTRGMENTLFQTAPGNPSPLFNVGGVSHPYLQKELLRKIYGSITTRSNVFAVWATVGFFECDNTVTPPRLGAEMGASENRQIRHRMFSIVDRTQLQMWPTYQSGTSPVRFQNGTTTPTVSVATAIAISSSPQAPQLSTNSVAVPDSATGYTWTAQPGAILVYEPNTDNEETVVLDTNSQAVFRRNHAVGVPVIVRGNPGPLSRYDPRQDTAVVPYFALID